MKRPLTEIEKSIVLSSAESNRQFWNVDGIGYWWMNVRLRDAFGFTTLSNVHAVNGRTIDDLAIALEGLHVDFQVQA